MGVTVPAATAGIVVGVVDSNSRLRPVRIVPFWSFATDVIGWTLLGFTTTLLELPETPGTLNAIEVGGHVEKNPAELPAFAIFAVMTVDPGCCAVATPF
jgi:energy-converting hydrogenase Eha subunit B